MEMIDFIYYEVDNDMDKIGYDLEFVFVIDENAAKNHGKSRSRTDALRTYGNPRYRFEGYSHEDIKFMKSNLNRTLLKMFAYDW